MGSLVKEAHSQADNMKNQFDKEASSNAKKYEQETSTLKAQLQDALDMKERDGNRVKTLTKELEAATERCTCYENTIDSLEKSITEMQSQTENQKVKYDEQIIRNTQITELKQEVESQYRSANSSIVQLKENIEKKNVAIEQLQGKLDDIDKQNNVKHQNMKEETSKEKEQLSNEITLLR